MLFHGLTTVTQECAEGIVAYIRESQIFYSPKEHVYAGSAIGTINVVEGDLAGCNYDGYKMGDVSRVRGVRNVRGPVMKMRLTDLETYYACKEDPNRPGNLICLLCSAEKGYTYIFKGTPSIGKKHFARCHKSIGRETSLQTDVDRHARTLAIRQFIDEAKRKAVSGPAFSKLSADVIGNSICDVILMHGVAYSQANTLKQLLASIVSGASLAESYSPEVRAQLLASVLAAKVSRSTVQRRSLRSLSLHRQLLHGLIAASDGYSLLLGALPVHGGRTMCLVVLMNALVVKEHRMQTIICGLPNLPTMDKVQARDILDALLCCFNVSDSSSDSVQQEHQCHRLHHPFLKKLIAVTLCEELDAFSNNFEKLLNGAVHAEVECDKVDAKVHVGIFGDYGNTLLQRLGDILSATFANTVDIVEGILKDSLTPAYQGVSSNTQHAKAFESSLDPIKQRCNVTLKGALHSSESSVIFAISLPIFEQCIEYLQSRGDNGKYATPLDYEHEHDTAPSRPAAYTSGIRSVDDVLIRRIVLLRDILVALAPLEAILACRNVPVWSVYQAITDLDNKLTDIKDALISAVAPSNEEQPKHIAPIVADTSLYVDTLVTCLQEVHRTLGQYTPHIQSFGLCVGRFDDAASTHAMAALTRYTMHTIPDTLERGTAALVEEYCTLCHELAESGPLRGTFTNAINEPQTNEWHTMIKAWFELHTTYPLVSRHALLLLTTFSTSTLLHMSRTIIAGSFSAQRSSLTKTNIEAALLIQLNAQLCIKSNFSLDMSLEKVPSDWTQ